MRCVTLAVLLCWATQVFAEIDPNVNLQAVSRQGNEVWVSGTQGAIYRSKDSGKNWQAIAGPSNTSELQFRDIQLLPSGRVVLMSAGEGKASRIYITDDHGVNWQLVQQGQHLAQFFDCMSFTNSDNGWLYGDSDEQGLFVLQTHNGGLDWQRVETPAALPSEGGFASSGSCILANSKVFIGTGNAENARLLIKDQQHWQALNSPFTAGEAAGIFTLQQRGEWLYLAGGSLKTPEQPAQAYRFHLGRSEWQTIVSPPLKGAIYGSVLNAKGDWYLSNPGGIVKWLASEQKWQMVSENNSWAMSCAEQACLAVGAKGTITHFY